MSDIELKQVLLGYLLGDWAEKMTGDNALSKLLSVKLSIFPLSLSFGNYEGQVIDDTNNDKTHCKKYIE